MRHTLLIVALVACSDRSPAVTSGKPSVQSVVDEIATDFIARWAVKHPDRRCPAGIVEVLAAVGKHGDPGYAQDPWGRPYRVLCGASLPAGVKQAIGIVSAGEDGREGTADDVVSWVKAR